ncbi:MAG: hypothetical protein WDO69_20860 [Pseudomonadota bacterium]
MAGLLVPQRVHRRSGGRCGENSNCGAAGRMGASLTRAPPDGAAGAANVAGGAKKGGTTDGLRGAAGGLGAGAGAGAAG